jgi:transposase
MTRKRRTFSDEYKAEVVKLIEESEKSIAQVCRELDLTETAVRRWVAQSEVDAGRGATGVVTSEEREELRRLRRENTQLRMERDILKKATAFFARESS